MTKGLRLLLALAVFTTPIVALAGPYEISLDDEQYTDVFLPDFEITLQGAGNTPGEALTEKEELAELVSGVIEDFPETISEVVTRSETAYPVSRDDERRFHVTQRLQIKLNSAEKLEELQSSLSTAASGLQDYQLSFRVTGGSAPSKADWSNEQREKVEQAFRKMESELARQALDRCQAANELLKIDCKLPARVRIDRSLSGGGHFPVMASASRASLSQSKSLGDQYERVKLSIRGEYVFNLAEPLLGEKVKAVINKAMQ